ncbi:MAG: hypothetical protein LR001_09105, partial [Clostridiales bacterium]|nr:hypothetical protein [Clostridiales bacterium]
RKLYAIAFFLILFFIDNRIIFSLHNKFVSLVWFCSKAWGCGLLCRPRGRVLWLFWLIWLKSHKSRPHGLPRKAIPMVFKKIFIRYFDCSK